MKTIKTELVEIGGKPTGVNIAARRSVLSPAEIETLDAQERTIADGLETFMSVGEALVVIRDKRLYRAEYKQFEEYCRNRWGFSKTHANRLIAASTTAKELAEVSPLAPKTETLIRPLTGMPTAMARKVWKEVLKTSAEAENPKRITAAFVRQVAREMNPKATIPRKKDRMHHAAPKQTALVRREDVVEAVKEWTKSLGDKKLTGKEIFSEIEKLVEKI